MTDRDIIEIAKLDGENFTIWKFGIVIALKAKDLFGYVNGTEKQPKAEKADELKLWEKRSNQALMMLLGSGEKALHYNLMSCSTPVEMWDKIQTLYGDSSLDAKENAWEKFYSFKINEQEKLAVQLERFQCICKKLDDAGDKPSDTEF